MGDLKYRERVSSSVDKGIYRSMYNYSIETKIPLSRLLDEAIEDFLNKHDIDYLKEEPYKKVKK